MKNIKRWLEKGLIDENLAKILLDETKCENNKRMKLTTQILLYTIGVILIGIAVISFIAGNDWILELFKNTPLLSVLFLFVLALCSLWGGYFLKYEKQIFPKLGDSLIFLSTLLIGANYIRIGQIYNWNSNASSILALWFLSIYPLAFVFKSKPINILSLVLFLVTFPYFYYDLGIDKIEAWTIFMPFSLCLILYTFANSSFIQKNYPDFAINYKLTALVPAFFTFLILMFSINPKYQMINFFYIFIPAILLLINLKNYLTTKENLRKIESVFLVFLSVLLLFFLILPSLEPVFVVFCAHLFIIYIISNGFYYGYKFENVSLINLSDIFLLIYLLTSYSRYCWDYIDKTLFFLIGGVFLLLIGIKLEKGKNKIIKKADKTQNYIAEEK